MSKPKTESCETLKPALKDPAAATVAALLLIVQLPKSRAVAKSKEIKKVLTYAIPLLIFWQFVSKKSYIRYR